MTYKNATVSLFPWVQFKKKGTQGLSALLQAAEKE